MVGVEVDEEDRNDGTSWDQTTLSKWCQIPFFIKSVARHETHLAYVLFVFANFVIAACGIQEERDCHLSQTHARHSYGSCMEINSIVIRY